MVPKGGIFQCSHPRCVCRINPVKIILHVFPSISRWHIATLSIGLMAYVFLSEMKQVLYNMVKIFSHSILSIFFRDVEVVGRHNIPRGPCIFTVNHANQFVDALMVLSTCQRKVSYLMAEASWKRRLIGDLAWALDVVPVKRAQDSAIKGTGTLEMTFKVDTAEERVVTAKGTGTKFQTEVAAGDKIRPPGTPVAMKVMSVESDTEITLNAIEITGELKIPEGAVPFDVLKKVDTKVVFEKVLDRLAEGGAVGIFPEGGSHDRTELLPLKVGISLIAYGALDRDGLNVPIVPVGLNYFRAHRWRGRAVIEYGRPISIDPSTLKSYQAGGKDKHAVCNKLLEEVEYSMRSVIVSAPDYETLQILHTARRLYQKNTGPMDTSEKQDLSRRFAEGYKRLMLMTDGKPPKEWLELQDRIVAYKDELKDLGLKDYQVPALQTEKLDEEMDVRNVDGDKILSILQLLYQIGHILFLLLLAAFPVLFLNLPVGVLAGLYAERRREKLLAKSKVKIRGYDVMLTEKVVFCIVMVPTLWIFYGIMLMSFADLDGPTISLIFLCMPVFAYMGIVVAEAGMVELKDLKPLFVRMFPSSRKRLAKLPETRKQLQDDLRGT